MLGTRLTAIPLEELRNSVIPALIEADGGADEEWEQLVLRHGDGIEIAAIEKSPVTAGELGAEELEELLEEVARYQPTSASNWLQNYLPNIKVIYAFQLLSGTDVNDGWAPLHTVYSAIWNHAGGILQADGEGFSNEDGYTILWQFGESASGAWNVGVLANGAWVNFEIDLGNTQHREAFCNGDIPVGVKVHN